MSEIVTELISIVLPSIVTECAKRFEVLTTDSELGKLYDSISEDILKDCETDDTPSSKLLLGLSGWIDKMKEQIIAEARDTIKDEIRMELSMEMMSMIPRLVQDEMRKNNNNKNNNTNDNTNNNNNNTNINLLDFKPTIGIRAPVRIGGDMIGSVHGVPIITDDKFAELITDYMS